MDKELNYDTKLKPLYDIIGAAFASYRWFKGGLQESVYEVGLKIEIEKKGYKVLQQEDFIVWYKGQKTDKKYRMDLVVNSENLGNIILELKALNAIDDKQRKQLWSYMRLTNTQYGMLINFGPDRVFSEKWKYIPENNTYLKL